eukprot:TRINITY_DN2318_c0_g1::TRINITY_DN2318_c0_g1_i1::g.20819::m.20819 TRINITY_DN2318_c0_g1::TRINITY_DN2318_c0_g1_i1::g.20819  ORF type:complete len:638 (+),score=163.79,sp/Q9DBG7/SRPRA_MOUSE/42.55/3e-154,SRP54/PF00448.17/2.5e-55,SRP-alpha_N/PF04086.8/3.3e-50,AAA_22/PF13401.1/3.6e-07,ArgK/PF03308.11/5.2e-06,CbiA/PF01656.18/6.4e-06,SRP54_N/PF02881.14/4.9e+03,SRP54_N/PF02881.14/6.7e+03,SRP54_N/PF02881.14/2e-05,MobB/PF03205.9/0.0043,MobB/PF03205.9/30,AAA_30/PF13604.1/0.00015,AAA_33/PF13671.1/0.0069,AAA_29
MIDLFTIFSQGGVVLWSKSFNASADPPINDCVRTVLIEERTSEKSYSKNGFTLKWTLANDLQLIFVCVYQNILQLLYIDELLDAVKDEFCALFAEEIKAGSKYSRFDFDSAFSKTLDRIESKHRNSKGLKAPRSFEETKKYQNIKKDNEKKAPTNAKGKKATAGKNQEKTSKDEDGGDSGSGSDDAYANDSTALDGSGSGSDDGMNTADIEMNRAKLREKLAGKGKKKNAPKTAEEPEKKPTEKKQKKATVWDDTISRADAKALDRSKKDEGEATAKRADFFGTPREAESGDDTSDDDTPTASRKNAVADNSKKNWGSGMLSFVTSIVSGKDLSEDDVRPALGKLKEQLMTKNVARDIADKICDSVCSSLISKRLESFTSVQSVVKSAIEDALTRILTPKQSVDILAEIKIAREQGRPYVIVFCGVNGVGKSTTLSKVAYWLTQNNLQVLIAACDTFRSGAVEQLRVHARNLDIPLYEKGYGKDAASIAKDAIRHGAEIGADVVLVDTAGRMQGNEPLMRALVKLVNVNKPDKILFVGEALVGNDAVDQLSEFNRLLGDLSTLPSPRLIDGIVLTKFDTIDDKVGAAVSMVYTTGQPIVFVGVGQTYMDLKRCNVKSLVKALLK